jgi:HEAT repeat protein
MDHDSFTTAVAASWSRAVFEASHAIDAYRTELLLALTSADARVRSAAVAAFNEANDCRSHDAVVALIDDVDPVVRHEVAEYLEEFATQDDFPRLLKHLSERPTLFSVTTALCRLTGWADGLLNGDESDEVVSETVGRWRKVAGQIVTDGS